MSHANMSRTRPGHSFAAPRLGRALIDLLALSRQRRDLELLDDHLLDDIGLTRDDAQRESARTIWDAPAHWRR